MVQGHDPNNPNKPQQGAAFPTDAAPKATPSPFALPQQQATPFPTTPPQPSTQVPQLAPTLEAPSMGDGEALGFQAQKRDEKYNTQYLTNSIHSNRRNGQLIVGGLVSAAILGAITWMLLMPASESTVLEKEPIQKTDIAESE